jgi:MFS transporter, YNFM family, putative membrane transport protein
VLTGMVLVGVGTFFAQAAATGFVGQAASENRGVASGTYLACYFFGGMVGSAVLGQLFDRLDWAACVVGVGTALAIAAWLTIQLKLPTHKEGDANGSGHEYRLITANCSRPSNQRS